MFIYLQLRGSSFLSFGEAEVDEYDDNMLIDSVRFEPAKKVL